MMDFNGWQYYLSADEKSNHGIKFTDANGCFQCRLLTDPEVAEWVAEGNTPLPAENE